jgi:hypothetical protein
MFMSFVNTDPAVQKMMIKASDINQTIKSFGRFYFIKSKNKKLM